MRLFWTPEAIDDRRSIYDYIEADNPSAALALDELFSEKANRRLIILALAVSVALQVRGSWWRIRTTS